jgi:aminopeptidase N
MSNSKILSSQNGTTRFEPTPPISTYLYGLDCGHYTVIENSNKEFKIPLRVACRKSKVKYLNPDLFFRTLEQTMAFYEDMFSTPFPFAKYDTIWCPDFRIGGMENVGLINIADSFLKDPSEMQAIMNQFVFIIHIHEMSHMWFGDLVTMRWWNDLWLKESFADYVCGLCLNHLGKSIKEIIDPEQAFMHYLT